MNPLTLTCLVAAAALTACGQPPPPRAPQPEVTSTSTSAATTTADVVAPTTTSKVVAPTTTTNTPPKPPRTTTTKPPPPPKPPDRWVLPAGLRGSIEQQDAQFFPASWGRIQGQVAEVCPGQTLCVGHALVIDPASELTDDCFIVPGGISVPDPLHEGGTITFRVTNDLCSGG